MKGKGPAEIEKIIATDIATILKDTKMELTVVQYRAVGKDAAWVELEHSVNGAKSPDGKPLPPMTFHVPALLVKKGKNWMIEEARPYAYLPPPPAPVAAQAGRRRRLRAGRRQAGHPAGGPGRSGQEVAF